MPEEDDKSAGSAHTSLGHEKINKAPACNPRIDYKTDALIIKSKAATSTLGMHPAHR